MNEVEKLIPKFAETHRLRIKRDVDGTYIIPGNLGDSHIYDYSDEELGVLFMPTHKASDKPRTKLWNSVRRKCIAAGMTLRQNGDDEGALSFDPNNAVQVKLAIKCVRARARRRVSEAHRMKLVANAALARAARFGQTLNTEAL
jgi:hypothetical protein